MKKTKIALLITASTLYGNLSYADGWAVSSTLGSSKYEYTLEEQAVDPYTQTIDGSFLYRDIGIDYSWDAHQLSFKVGGLAKEEDVVTASEIVGTSNFQDNGDVDRSEYQIAYTYRLENGISITGGYYKSTTNLDYVSSFDAPDYFEDGSNIKVNDAGNRTKEISSSGVFLGAAYGFSFTDRLGAYVRGGYQVSSMDTQIIGEDHRIALDPNGTAFYTEDVYFNRKFDTDSTAMVGGIGVFYAVTDSLVASLNYDIKKYDYDTSRYYSTGTYDTDYYGQVDSGDIDYSFEENDVIKMDESQSTLSLTLRYMF
jgi:hypothetical protein